jgi:hypothetical protein
MSALTSTRVTSKPKAKRVNVKLFIDLHEIGAGGGRNGKELDPYDHIKAIETWINHEVSPTGYFNQFFTSIKGPVKLTRMADGYSVRAGYSFIVDDRDEMYAVDALKTGGYSVIVIEGRRYYLTLDPLKISPSAADKAIQAAQKKQATEALKRAKAQLAEAKQAVLKAMKATKQVK